MKNRNLILKLEIQVTAYGGTTVGTIESIEGDVLVVNLDGSLFELPSDIVEKIGDDIEVEQKIEEDNSINPGDKISAFGGVWEGIVTANYGTMLMVNHDGIEEGIHIDDTVKIKDVYRKRCFR